MPIPPKMPQQWSCSQCKWRYAPVIQSDVLIPKPEKCPKCGSEVVLKPADTIMGRLAGLFQLR